MKGKIGMYPTKLKLNPALSNLNHGLVLQLNPSDVFFNSIYVDGDDDEKHFQKEEMGLEEKMMINKDKGGVTIIGLNNKETDFAELLETKMELKRVPSIEDFEELCPPEGNNSIILYTTSLTGIRKTFQDCNIIHFLLTSFKIKYQERDVSLHLEYREELWKIFGGNKVIPPKLFIKGRYIGGAEEVVKLHEMGWLQKLLEGTPIHNSDCPCICCSNIRFIICTNCCGSCKVFTTNEDTNDECFIKCSECNENGLVKCPICN